jgi:NAD(P)-dependent dehydrogenase (short-subunit alcohol dehydrogenase family)
MDQLKDKIAIVTGAARGIGQEFCIALAKEGAKVVATDIRSCEETVNKIKEAGGEAFGVITDVSSEISTNEMAAKTLQRFGRIDILVNNAGFYSKLIPFDQISETEWDQTMAVNVKGVWLCSKAVIPTMKQQGKGKIINISSDTIDLGLPNMLAYVASKGAVFALTRALARELSGTEINVNAIAPGYTITEAALSIADPEAIPKFKQQTLDKQIIKRLEQPSDLSGTVVFLSSDASDFITGQSINVDGGLTHH